MLFFLSSLLGKYRQSFFFSISFVTCIIININIIIIIIIIIYIIIIFIIFIVIL